MKLSIFFTLVLGLFTDALAGQSCQFSQAEREEWQARRRELLNETISACGRKHLETIFIPVEGRQCEVTYDNVSKFGNTYIPLTFPEAQRLAAACQRGFRLPTEAELVAIGQYARQRKLQVPAIPRTPNNNENLQICSMYEMMTDPRMKSRAETGHLQLIDGHFKWYTSDDRIYGFAKGDGGFYQSRASAAHKGNKDYYDYSHGLRLIRCF